jgi:hypothetical protein
MPQRSAPAAAGHHVVGRRDRTGKDGVLRWLGVSLLLAPGLAGVGWAQGASQFDGHYMGELTLTKTVSGDCTEPQLGALFPLKVSGGEVRFAYLPRFDTILRGRVAADGNFQASARAKDGVVRMTGQIQDNNITATIVSPSCRYTFKTGN